MVEAGCYITAGSKLTLPDGDVVKAATLSGRTGLQLLAQQRHRRAGGPAASQGGSVALNDALHANA